MKKGMYTYLPFERQPNGFYRAIQVAHLSSLSKAREIAKEYGLSNEHGDIIARYHIFRGMEDKDYTI